ncbi:unnamed protein product [Sphagnum troendelagicum]|uniref:Uncharacterized protein n=1 Tax=Sphagnum troendelagicum TaxID=128251 RepID=A0ABP0TSJ5_9BRYO
MIGYQTLAEEPGSSTLLPLQVLSFFARVCFTPLQWLHSSFSLGHAATYSMLAWGKDAHSPSKIRSATGRIETTDRCAADKCVHTAEENTACSSELIAKTYKIQCRSGKARHSASSSGRLLAALVASRTQQSATKKEGIHTNRFPTTIPLSPHSRRRRQRKRSVVGRQNTERRTEHAIDQQFRHRQQTQNEN